MSINITNLGGTINYNDHHKEVTINTHGTNVADIVRTFMAEDITPAEDSSISSDYQSDSPSSIDSIIFTKKAKKEGKIPAIIDALRKSMQRRRDKSRALVEELAFWQKDEYVDAHYNAQVMYDEITKIIPLPFGYEAFKQHYNHTRS